MRQVPPLSLDYRGTLFRTLLLLSPLYTHHSLSLSFHYKSEYSKQQ